MAQLARFWRLLAQFGSHFQQSSIGFPVRHDDEGDPVDSICLLDMDSFSLLLFDLGEDKCVSLLKIQE
ncbi:hypothetical protein RHGRI_007484 [Rhododendron griersonianum]|uniref:Uncharacterized protein n=1 Tax=Rhododendron griersonianum TaxID=479676 RepID=A0AAV6KWX7_9ERIC|nr:hypothetical protein RHGRI_007484 [Rhododendron griersonianum]